MCASTDCDIYRSWLHRIVRLVRLLFNLNESNTMFQTNDKVVCVDDAPARGNNRHRGAPLPIEKGVVYVVRGMETLARTGTTVVYLVGIYFPKNRDGLEYGFEPNRFRKLSDIRAENAAKRAEVRSAERKW